MCTLVKDMQDEARAAGRLEGIQAGIQEGIHEGRQEGSAMIIKLMSKIVSEGLSTEIPRLASDAEFLEEMKRKIDMNIQKMVRYTED